MLLKIRYDESDMEILDKNGKVVYRTGYRIDLADSYEVCGVRIDERLSVDPRTMSPWFVCFCYSDLPQEKRAQFIEAVDNVYKKRNGFVFKNSSDSGTIRVNILARKGKTNVRSIGTAIKDLKELEKIICS